MRWVSGSVGGWIGDPAHVAGVPTHGPTETPAHRSETAPPYRPYKESP